MSGLEPQFILLFSGTFPIPMRGNELSSTRLLHLGRAKGVCAARLPRSPCVEAGSRCQVFEAGSPVEIRLSSSEVLGNARP